MFRYVYTEVRYGVNLYVNNWKRVFLNPRQVVKDIGKAVLNPINTAKFVGREIKKHPIGMSVNIGLNWATGRMIGSGVEYLPALQDSASNINTQIFSSVSDPSSLPSMPALLDASTPCHSSHIAELGGISTVLQIVQCGGRCAIGSVVTTATSATTVSHLGQTALLSQELENTKKSCGGNGHCYNVEQRTQDALNQITSLRQLSAQKTNNKTQVSYSRFSPYFDDGKKEGFFDLVMQNLSKNRQINSEVNDFSKSTSDTSLDLALSKDQFNHEHGSNLQPKTKQN